MAKAWALRILYKLSPGCSDVSVYGRGFPAAPRREGKSSEVLSSGIDSNAICDVRGRKNRSLHTLQIGIGKAHA